MVMEGFSQGRPFCDDCQFADWDGAHSWPCSCGCHIQAIRVRPLAERTADWQARKVALLWW